MKKTFMIALAGLMLFAFTQCGGGSKEFQDSKKAIKEQISILKGIKTCEDLEKAEEKLEKISDEMDEKEYDEKDQMTPEEKEEFQKLVKEMMTLALEKYDLCDD